MYRKDLTKKIRQIERYLKSNYLDTDFKYARFGSVLDPIEYNIENGDYDPDAIGALINAYKDFMRIMKPEIYEDKKFLKLVESLSKAIRKSYKRSDFGSFWGRFS